MISEKKKTLKEYFPNCFNTIISLKKIPKFEKKKTNAIPSENNLKKASFVFFFQC